MQIQSFDELATEKELKLFGKTTAQKFQRLKIIIIGLSSLGLEIAKHISTQQPELITLCDSQSQRLKQCEQLLKINNVTQIETLEMSYKDNEILSKIDKHDLTIICDIQSLNFAIAVSEHLRQNASKNQKYNKGVIWTCTFGFICIKFSDFGQGFKVFDRDGVQPFPYHIINITNSNPGIVKIHESIPHNYKTGDFVRISNVEGMTQVNGPEARPIKVISQTEFSIEHTQHFNKYLAGGLVQLTKVPFKFHFQKLSETIYKPNTLKTNEDKVVYSTVIANLQLLDQTSKPQSEQEIINIALAIYKTFDLDQFDVQLCQKTIKFMQTTKYPVISLWAGYCSLEVVKFTGKFTPQECSFIQFISDIDNDEQQIKIKLQSLNALVIGSGGTGCEVVRLFSLMECCTQPNSKLTILDDDIVRKYTLGTHYWFNQQTLGMSKADVAKDQAQLLCSSMNIDVDKSKFSEKSEIIVKQHDIIFSAINNQTSRLLIQQQAQKHNKILFDQILNGLKAYTQFGKPNQQLQIQETLKNVYNVDQDTYKKFPYLPIHCVLWAKEVFDNSFVGFVTDFQKFLQDRNTYLQNFEEPDVVDNYHIRAHVINRISKPGFNLTLDKILSLSKELYEFHFEFKINQLLKQYPTDALECVWTGYKKIPQPIKFDSNNMDHVAYIQITTLLISKLFNINASSVFKQEYVIDKLQQMTENYWNLTNPLVPTPTEYSSQNKPQFLNFDDDQVRGLYVRCIHSLTNLRCKNYNLQPIPLYKVQKYALEMHRSNPIMHSIIVGWMGIELNKYLYGNCKQRNMHIDVNNNILEFI
ncbi:unnamed protein product [Paramecium primaurelia]|uniref:Uncharacterized protein n=1 Tax=Paramecium primaurelia TaxID=5886 RepID=A0A8S1L0K0_PARPR|nr:unnamed protein product [Paramecium primaurelia]